MKLLDKLKNVFFEEVEEDEEEEEALPQSFAKKVELPKKKIEPKELNEFDSRKEEVKVEKDEEKQEEDSTKVEEETEKEKEKEFPMMFDDDDFMEDNVSYDIPSHEEERKTVYKRETREYNEEKGLYQGKKELSYVESINNKPTYSYTKNYYEEKDTKGFRPSPIISPIYGILDKNYHKEEVITKRETRIASTYNKPDLDSIRNKAFGSDLEESKEKKESNHQDTKEEKVYDVNSNKPQVNKVTLADADEYYNDLGLAYNVDYSDASRSTSRVSKYNPKDKKKSKADDDNLFDLIDSMYNKED